MSPFFLGIFFILLNNLIVAAKQVYVGHLLQQFDTILLVFSCFLLTTFFFHALLVLKGKPFCPDIHQNRKDLFFFNLTTVGSWLGFFYALKFIEPAIAAVIMTAVGPLITIVLNPFFRPKEKILKTEIFVAIALLIVILFLGFITNQGKSALGDISTIQSLLGILASFVGGLSIVGNLFYAKRMNDLGWDTIQTLASRFYLLLLITGAISVFQGSWHFLDWYAIRIIVMITGLGIILPLYLKQLGINRTEPIFASILMASSPILTIGFQFLDKRLTFSYYSMTAIVIVVGLLFIAIIARIHKRDSPQGLR